MRRREFITVLGGAAGWPIATRAQQLAAPVIGILGSGSPSAFADLLGSFREGLRETGYIEGQNVAIESRWAEGRFERLSSLAADLMRHNVVLIFATGVSSALAAKAAASTTPLLFLSQDDPVKLRLVTSFNLPGGNATGMSLLTGALVAKRLELLRQLAASDMPTFYLMNRRAPEAEFHLWHMEAAARTLAQQFSILNASSEPEIDDAFAALSRTRGALIVSTDPFLVSRSHQIVALAAYNKIPTIYDRREFVTVGGLISYGTHLPSAYREMGVYAGKIVNGTKPSELPVMQPTRFEMVINVKTAEALGLNIPDRVLALADEVIE